MIALGTPTNFYCGNIGIKISIINIILNAYNAFANIVQLRVGGQCNYTTINAVTVYYVGKGLILLHRIRYSSTMNDLSLFQTILDVLVGHVWIVVKGTLIRGELGVLYIQAKSLYLPVVQPKID